MSDQFIVCLTSCNRNPVQVYDIIKESDIPQVIAMFNATITDLKIELYDGDEKHLTYDITGKMYIQKVQLEMCCTSKTCPAHLLFINKIDGQTVQDILAQITYY